MKMLVFLLLILMCSASVFAIGVKQQKKIFNQVKSDLGFKDVRGVFGGKGEYTAFYSVDYNKGSLSRPSVRFFNECKWLTAREFTCLVYHEFGHHAEVLQGSREEKLNESFADDFMLSHAEGCSAWY